MELQAPEFSQAQYPPLWPFEEWMSNWKIPFFMPLSVNSAFQINQSFFKKGTFSLIFFYQMICCICCTVVKARLMFPNILFRSPLMSLLLHHAAFMCQDLFSSCFLLLYWKLAFYKDPLCLCWPLQRLSEGSSPQNSSVWYNPPTAWTPAMGCPHLCCLYEHREPALGGRPM